jgi:hypothetical protein
MIMCLYLKIGFKITIHAARFYLVLKNKVKVQNSFIFHNQYNYNPL